MNQIKLPNGRVTTQLGFGCGPLEGGLRERHSRAIIDLAYEVGFRHFDVAPNYGFGLIETVVGRALRTRRQDVTLTTKSGITSRKGGGLMLSLVGAVARPVLAKLPGWSSVTERTRIMTAQSREFGVKSVSRSLEQSLRRLRTTHIDIFLMHDMCHGDAAPALIDMLVERKEVGIIGALGTGTTRAEALAIAADTPVLGEVQQYCWNVLMGRLLPSMDSITLTHGAIVPALHDLGRILAADTQLCTEWSAALEIDLTVPSLLADVLLAAALVENRHGLVLVHSQKPTRIKRFVEVASNDSWLAKGAQLLELVANRGGSAVDKC